MSRMPLLVRLATCGALAACALGRGHVDAQVDLERRPAGDAAPPQAAPPASGTARPPTFEETFWRYLRDAAPAYRTWAPFPGRTADFHPGESPHGAFLKTYVNRTAAADPVTLPPGSIVVEENYGPDRETLLAVTVMYRVQGFNANGGDWYWTKYEVDGRVATKETTRLAGKVQSCIDCHADAKGNDFVFAND
jgi:hypothetical protein